MFRLEDGRELFYQWDIGRRLIISDETVKQVHFCNKTDDCSLVCEVYEEGGVRLVDVPNILLQESWPINVYAYCGDNYTKTSKIFKVKARTKPDSYVYVETEVLTWGQLSERIEQNKADIETKASIEYVDKAVENVDVDLTGYATEKYVDDAIAAIDIPEGGGVTSWNELEDKPFYTGEGEIIIFQDDYVAVNQYGEGPNAQYRGQFTFGSIDVLTTGKDYYVVINDEEYKCICTWGTYEGDAGEGGWPHGTNYYLGNRHLLDETKEDTGEPFVLQFSTDSDTVIRSGGYLYTTEAGEYTVKLIDLDTTTVHKLDARYLPENVAHKGEVESYVAAAIEAKNYTTEDDVNTLINTALGVIENGSY